MSRSSALVVVMPERFFSPDWLALFEAHFASYGSVQSWTALPKFQRVILIYDEAVSALKAKKEMDGFVWDPLVDQTLYSAPTLLRQSQERLAPPTLEKNFLISPPGSPPVGWEQIEEDEPNKNPFPQSAGDDEDEWVKELERALRFLSVGEAGEPIDEDSLEDGEPKVILSAQPDDRKPAITISTPPRQRGSLDSSPTVSPPPGAAKITSVKATVTSLLGPSSVVNQAGNFASSRQKITPTARPPTEEDFSAFDDM